MANGLVHINTTTASSVLSVAVDNVFSSAYRNYLIVIDGTATGQRAIAARLRTGGVAASGSDYYFQYSSLENTTNVRTRSTLTLFDFGVLGTTSCLSVTNMFSPALAAPTRVEGRFVDHRVYEGVYTTLHSLSTSYDGLEVFVSGDLMTVKISIYGYVFS